MNKILFVALACAAGLAHAGDLYKWTDAQGVQHFSDTPPPQSQVAPAQVTVDRNKISDADSTLYAAPKTDEKGTAPTPPPAPSAPTAAAASNNDIGRACDQARSNLRLLQGKTAVADAYGKVLDDKARAAALEQAQRSANACR